jgi:hypothetical protein
VTTDLDVGVLSAGKPGDGLAVAGHEVGYGTSRGRSVASSQEPADSRARGGRTTLLNVHQLHMWGASTSHRRFRVMLRLSMVRGLSRSGGRGFND